MKIFKYRIGTVFEVLNPITISNGVIPMGTLLTVVKRHRPNSTIYTGQSLCELPCYTVKDSSTSTKYIFDEDVLSTYCNEEDTMSINKFLKLLLPHFEKSREGFYENIYIDDTMELSFRIVHDTLIETAIFTHMVDILNVYDGEDDYNIDSSSAYYSRRLNECKRRYSCKQDLLQSASSTHYRLYVIDNTLYFEEQIEFKLNKEIGEKALEDIVNLINPIYKNCQQIDYF